MNSVFPVYDCTHQLGIFYICYNFKMGHFPLIHTVRLKFGVRKWNQKVIPIKEREAQLPWIHLDWKLQSYHWRGVSQKCKSAKSINRWLSIFNFDAPNLEGWQGKSKQEGRSAKQILTEFKDPLKSTNSTFEWNATQFYKELGLVWINFRGSNITSCLFASAFDGLCGEIGLGGTSRNGTGSGNLPSIGGSAIDSGERANAYALSDLSNLGVGVSSSDPAHQLKLIISRFSCKWNWINWWDATQKGWIIPQVTGSPSRHQHLPRYHCNYQPNVGVICSNWPLG